MLKYLYILLFILGLNINCVAHRDDTTKIKIEHFDIKPTIINTVFNSLIENNFNKLLPFCNSYVEVIFLQKNGPLKETGTDCKAIQTLNHFILKIDYVKFKTMSGKNINGEDIIINELFMFEDDENYVVNIAFILDRNSSITKIIIY